ncbi:MAG: helix-turn-helix domain-containing protein [Deltaproteobacteria bacterium]|nr:helix-turn-helix domain-containing protein [Deltaproteobacteria bacterium]
MSESKPFVDQTLGQYLRQQREARRVSAEALSRATCMSLPFIEALEEDNFGFFSQPENIPGYLQLYARSAGLDFEEILNRYKMQALKHDQANPSRSPLLISYVNTPIQRPPGIETSFRKSPDKRVGVRKVVFLVLISFLFTVLLAMGKDGMIPDLSLISSFWQENMPQKTDEIVPARSQELLISSAIPVNSQKAPALPIQTAASAIVQPQSENLPPPRVNSAQPEKGMVMGNRDSRRYHLPGMKYYDKIAPYHRVEFASEEEAIKAGYHKAPR